jgi:hypothetical protein
MKPKSKILSGCTSAQSSDCIIWNGPNIPCLDLETGMSITDVEHLIACKVCEIAGELDLSDLDLSCLIEQPDLDPEDKKLKLILQLLLDNQCSLKELIDSCCGSQSDESCCDLNLNLKCLKKFDDFGNEIPQDLNQTLQSLVNEVCDHKTRIEDLEDTVVDLQDQIDNLPDPVEYEEPIITTCVAIAKPVSESVVLLATDYCNYKTSIGTPTQIQAGLAQQCDNLNTTLGSEAGWNLAPQNLAQSFSNLWIAYCNVLNRLKAIEQTCCAPSCDKIKIGILADFDSDNEEVTLNFTSGAGTLIPSGFVDCGTTLTITDKDGHIKEFSALNITQGGVVGPLSLGGLSAGTLSFNFKTKFCLLDENSTVIMTCQDCIEIEQEYDGGGCCSITNSSTEPITVIYTVQVTSS